MCAYMPFLLSLAPTLILPYWVITGLCAAQQLPTSYLFYT